MSKKWSIDDQWETDVNHQRSPASLTHIRGHSDTLRMMSALPPRSGESPRRGTSRLEMMQVRKHFYQTIKNFSQMICFPFQTWQKGKSVNDSRERHHLVFWRALAVNHSITWWRCNCQSRATILKVACTQWNWDNNRMAVNLKREKSKFMNRVDIGRRIPLSADKRVLLKV